MAPSDSAVSRFRWNGVLQVWL